MALKELVLVPYQLHKETHCSIPISQTSSLHNTKVVLFHLLDCDNNFLHWIALGKLGFFYVYGVPDDKE